MARVVVFVPVVNYALMALLSVLPLETRCPLPHTPLWPWRSERVSRRSTTG